MIRFELINDLPCMVTGIWQRFGVHVFEGRCTIEDMDRMEAHGDAWLARHPGKIVELVIIHPSDAGMTMTERSRMQRIIKRWEKIRTAAATVILAEGLAGSLQRSILTGMTMMVPPPHPAKVFGATEAAVTFLAPHVSALVGKETSAEALAAAVAKLESDFRRARATSAAPA